MIINGLTLLALCGAIYFSYLAITPNETWWTRTINHAMNMTARKEMK